ncbi:DUF3274 domain-containing protein [Enterobacter hormaechei]|uniref:T6SS effector phospholipase Tle3 domain-containing protein n=1 Tax=Enterobacter hormaechei TaxID=158836 RepID=UPI0018EAC017|nr:DUF3274 domain-containing protein [Enterobacter hormaechei]MBJ6602555.1 DUF3274 domain-containing protein [Enterobacter hormaechei]HAS1810009.1 DUF3274 domain-containing protein [Enterobacter hormaechei subsp. xiangfangensis]HBM2824925.1 DUF3274 domain-containing protein [Enterobacter hormaechei subsp. xiangfangensis]
MSEKTDTTRTLELKYDDNGKPSWRSCPSHKNIKVRGGCDLPPHLPGLIILVHGVNSTGEWYQNAEESLCKGLNDRLGLNGSQFELKPNKYSTDCEKEEGKSNSSPSPLARRKLIENSERSPIIRFYWEYSSVRGEEDKYFIPLANADGEDYHEMKRTGIKQDDIQKKGPDALFILNSPYAMHNSQLNELSIPQKERISSSGRENTLSSIIEKIAKQSTHLSSVGYKGLCVGKFTDKTNWKPEGENVIRAGKIQERDNHGSTYIYFCPHDRVMGSLPLRSIGWQGLPNDKNGNPHPLIVKFKNNLYQRMLARNTPCGSYPDKQTPFGTLPDGKPFWDDDGDKYQSSSITYPDPPKWQTVFVNAEKVPEPINPSELAEFDETRVGKEHGSKQQDGWGEIAPKTGKKNDNTYDNYVNLYPNQDVVIGYKELPSGYVQEITRKETFEEKDKRLRTYVSQPTDHSTLPGNKEFMTRVVAYDLPIGYCDATWDKEFLSTLRYLADWTTGADPYMNTGVVERINEPSMISRETGIEEIIREKAKEYGY